MPNQWVVVSFVLDWVIRLGLGARILMRRDAVPVSLAWLVIVLVAPVIGAVAYLLVGETRLGSRRNRRYLELAAEMESTVAGLWRHRSEDWDSTDGRYGQIANYGTAAGGMPPLKGNSVSLLADSNLMLERLVEDIDAATDHCHILTYIWDLAPGPDRVADALARAARRGVACRVLVDDVGSRPFLNSPVAAGLRHAGVNVVAALPASFLRLLFVRIDLRNHRKIAVIDGHTAYAGSQNISDASFGSRRIRDAGPFIDATVRVVGPAAHALATVFLLDWKLDSGETFDDLSRFLPDFRPADDPAAYHTVTQVLPSGPGPIPGIIRQALLMTIYAAREEIVMTTPYFVPDEATKAALLAAAMRGVRVILVLPQVSDAPIVSAAARSQYLGLLEAGVQIFHFRDGLLHSKMLTVDRRIGLIGSSNFDMRSFWLNFEVTLFLYDDDFASVLRFLQMDYVSRSTEVELAHWRNRPRSQRAAENVARLLGPLL